jgi:hypothetical protein
MHEIFATRWDENPAALAALHLVDTAIVARVDGQPVAVCGAMEIWPGVWSVFMFATDRWPEVALSVTRWVKRHLIPALVAVGAHRAECHSIEGHHTAHRWLGLLGAHVESVARGMGKKGEDFRRYVWLREDFEHVC